MYKLYCDNDKSAHDCVIINNFENVTKLIESSDDGNIRIWNFHTGKLLNKIKVCNDDLYTIYLWSNTYLFVSCGEKVINIIDLEKKIIVNKLKEHKNWVITMKKIYHPLYGECLISQDSGNGEIKLWANEK
jgi:WD40 repeat protein